MTENSPNVKNLPLFRQQAVTHISTRQYGTVLLTSPRIFRWLTTFLVGIVVLIISFFFFFSTTRKAQCQGVLLPASGVIRVLPTQTGVVVDKRIKEGQVVKAGEVLFVLSSERSTSTMGNAQERISNLLQNRRDSYNNEILQIKNQTTLRQTTLQRKIVDIETELRKLSDQIVLQQQRVNLSEQALKRYSDLQAKNYFSPAQLQDKQAELLDQRQRLAEVQRLHATSQRDLTAVQSDLKELYLQAQRETSAMQRNISSIEEDLMTNEARRETIVTAPQNGTVSAITAELGKTVTPNTPLVSMFPSGAELEAEIYAPSRSIGFLKNGMTVLLRFQAYPYQKFGQYKSKIIEIANTPLRSEELALPSGTNSEPMYRIRLSLNKQTVDAYGKAMPLKPGMLVDASILLEERRLIEWILEPLYTISGR